METLASMEGFKMQVQMKVTCRKVWAVEGMIKLFPAICRDEILHSSVWAGVVMNHHNTPAKHVTSLILDRAVPFLKCVATDTCVDCGDLRQEVHKQNAFSVKKHCAHDLLNSSVLLEFRLCWR